MNVNDTHPTSRNAQGIEASAFNLGSANSKQFVLLGGIYVLDVVATGSGTVALQKVGPDGSTLITPQSASVSATGSVGPLYLAPGTYQITVTTLTAVYASVSSVPI